MITSGLWDVFRSLGTNESIEWPYHVRGIAMKRKIEGLYVSLMSNKPF